MSDHRIKTAAEIDPDWLAEYKRKAEESKKELENDPDMAYCEKHNRYYSKTETFRCDETDDEAVGVCNVCWRDGYWDRRDARIAKETMNNNLESLCLGPRFLGKTFADYVCQNDGQKNALEKAKGIVDRYESFKEKGTQVLFYGKSGTGKTMLEAIIAQELVKARHSVIVITVQQMIRSIRETFTRKESEQEKISKYSSVEFLMLDEVGVSLQSDYEKTVLFEILDERYKYKRPTLMTTNLSSSEIEKYLEFRLMRRFRDSNGLMVPFEWEEYKGDR